MTQPAQVPAAEPFLFTDGAALLCPHCQFNFVHVDDVYVAGRPREDGEVHPVHVDAGGRARSDSSVSLPIPDVGRRHVFALQGWCEGCGGHFTLEFSQHKGQTMVAIREPSWKTLTPKTP